MQLILRPYIPVYSNEAILDAEKGIIINNEIFLDAEKGATIIIIII